MEMAMKDLVLSAFTSLFLGLAVITGEAQSPEPLLGTFKVNPAKSTPNPGGQPPKSNISVWQALGDGQFKNTIDVVDATGQTTHTEVVTRFDGVESAVKGAPVPTTRTYTRLDGRRTGSPVAWQYVTKVNGKVTTTQRTIASSDGNTRISVVSGTDAEGRPFSGITVYERQ
jgi:hypothetical protein